MKIRIVFFWFFWLITNVNAQTECDHNVSTNWIAPLNDALPTDINYPNGDPRFLNSTNWFPLTSGGSFEDYDLTNMIWSGVPLLEMDNIWSTSIPYYNYINDSPRPLPENGWELLLVNFGRYPNDNDVIASNETFQALPYIVIYNRYSGVLRVFANFGLDQTVGNGPDAVRINLQFVDPLKVSGLARLYEGNDRSLDKSTNVTSMSVLAKATNAQRQWFSADFQIAYDPCTCYYPSEIQLSFLQIKNEQLTLHGRSLSVTDNLIDNDLKINELTFLSGFDYSGNDASGGILIYKGLQNLVNDYIARYEKYQLDLAQVNFHNEIVDNNLEALKMLKYMLTAVLTYGVNANSIDVAAASAESWFAKMNKQYGSFIKKANGTFDVNKILKIAKNILGSDAKTYIEQDFEKLPLPQEPDKSKIPSVTFTEMHFEGLISEDQLKGGPIFFTPGTYGTEATMVNDMGVLQNPILNTPYNYPIYNEVLGTFALLKSPEITISNRVVPGSVTEKNKNVLTSNNVYTNVYYKSWTKEYQIHLSEDLKYAVNSVLDVESTEVKAAFRFKAKNKVIFTNGQEFNTFIDPNHTTNVSSTNQNVNIFDPLRVYSNTPYTNDIFDGFGPVENASCNCFPDETISFQTPFVPLDAFYNMPIGVGLKEEFFQYFGNSNFLFETTQGVDLEFYDIELVLMVDMTFETNNSKGIQNSNFQILTFNLEENDVIYNNSYLVNNLSQQFDMQVLNENLSLSDISFDGQEVQGCRLVGNSYVCEAWNDIQILGNLTTVNNFSVEVIAGNTIVVNPEAIIDPEIVLKIVPALNFGHPMPQANAQFVQNFCKGSQGQSPAYQANISEKAVVNTASTSNENQDYSALESKWKFELFPNPTTSGTIVKIDNSTIAITMIEVTDMTGKKLEVITNPLGQNRFYLDMSKFNHGMYFVKVSSQSDTQVKPLIVE